MTSISRSAEFNRYRPVSQTRAEPGAERNQAYREVQRDFRADNNPARKAELESITAKQKRGETLTPHEQGLIDGQRRTTSTTETKSPEQTSIQKTLETSGYEQELVSGSVGKEWAAFQGSHTSGDVNGSFHNTVEGQALTAGANANGSVAFDPANGKVIASGSASAKADLVRGSVEGHVDSPVGKTSWQAEGNVGAEASVTGQVVVDPLHGDVAANVGGEAFAGARASGEVSQEIGPATATVGAEAFAGIGAEFEANVGLQDGKLSANFDVGAALGIGGSVEFGVELDVGKAVDTVKDIGGGIANAADKVFGGGW
ncbi:hypothetical protein NR798_06910 [Archangium gephyra]|uniref:hypothetical protein n=1 Tax=Archangium gephyra TaxID=48 RepID=UPI0035D4D3F6